MTIHPQFVGGWLCGIFTVVLVIGLVLWGEQRAVRRGRVGQAVRPPFGDPGAEVGGDTAPMPAAERWDGGA